MFFLYGKLVYIWETDNQRIILFSETSDVNSELFYSSDSCAVKPKAKRLRVLQYKVVVFFHKKLKIK